VRQATRHHCRGPAASNRHRRELDRGPLPSQSRRRWTTVHDPSHSRIDGRRGRYVPRHPAGPRFNVLHRDERLLLLRLDHLLLRSAGWNGRSLRMGLREGARRGVSRNRARHRRCVHDSRTKLQLRFSSVRREQSNPGPLHRQKLAVRGDPVPLSAASIARTSHRGSLKAALDHAIGEVGAVIDATAVRALMHEAVPAIGTVASATDRGRRRARGRARHWSPATTRENEAEVR
jgi:hypothetical protein